MRSFCSGVCACDAEDQAIDNMAHGEENWMLGIPSGDMTIDWNKVVFNKLTIKGIYGREIFETSYKMTTLIQGGLDLSTHHHPPPAVS